MGAQASLSRSTTMSLFLLFIGYPWLRTLDVDAFHTPPSTTTTTISALRQSKCLSSVIREMAVNPFDESILSSLPSIVTSKLSSYENLLEFNSQFKQGLKYVLVPNAPTNKNLKPSYYYEDSLPETLDAPIPNSMMDYTSTASFVPAANIEGTATTNLPSIDLPSIELPSVELPQINMDVHNIQLPKMNLDDLNFPTNIMEQLPTNIQLPSIPKSDLHVVINTDKIDAMGRDVDRVLQAARSIVSSSVEIASNSPIVDVAVKANTKLSSVATVANKQIIDPVVDRTIEQMKYALSHPPDYTGYTFTGAPPGQGLATPVIDAMAKAIQKARETPPLYYADPLPDDYVTISGGFQAKISAIETANKIQNSIYDTAQQIAANNVVIQLEAKKVLAVELEQIQTRNTIIAEKAAVQAQANLQYLHQLQDIVSNQIVANAQSIQNQMHISELKSTIEQNIIKALKVNDIYQSDQLRKMISSLKVEDFGGYYIGAIVGIVLVQLIQNEKQMTIQKVSDKISMETQLQLEQVNMEKQKLEAMVIELTEAVSLLTNELRILKSQRIQTDTVLASVVNNQQSKVSEENETLRKQIESMKAELVSLREARSATSSQLKPRPPHDPPPINPKIETKTELSLQNAFFAATVINKGVNKPDPTKEIPSPTSTKPRATATTSSADTNDWSSLPFTAIKRKPITEIIAYLQARGRNVIGTDGKPLSKSQLIESIFSF